MALLFLMRHAKAVKAKPGMADFDRPLEERGHRDAAAVGERLVAEFGAPAAVLCSAALRTRETLAGLPFAADEHTRFSRTLFDADGAGYLREIKAQDAADRLILIGHNPSVAEAAFELAGRGDDDAMSRLASGFPTSGIAVIEIGPELAPRSGTLRAFITPASLRP
ncbi:MAG: histidine phosphatase [Mesorhizobium amorphae]|nr:MAG: histidine phosphatase [Mesorhizobium amorphae]